MAAAEINDLLMFGDAVHSSKMDELQRRFVFGKVEKIDERGVDLNGRRVKRFGDVATVDTKAFVEERLEGVELPKERMKQKNDRLTEGAWLTVPAERGGLMRQQPPPDFFPSRKQPSDLAFRIQRIGEQRMRWGVTSDASSANARGGQTQGGHMLITFGQSMLEGQKLHRKRSKFHRAVSSTLTAETQSLARGIGDLLWMIDSLPRDGFELGD